MLVTKFFQADVYGVESLFVLHLYSVLFCTCCVHAVCKCVYLQCPDVSHVIRAPDYNNVVAEICTVHEP